MAGRYRSAFAVTALLGLVAVVSIGGFLAYRNRTADSGPVVQATQALISPSGQSSLIDPGRITVEASTTLASTEALTYGPRNTLDGDRQTAWNSDAAESVGQVLTYRFAEPVELTAVRFVNGYAKDDDTFAANHRLKTVLVTTDQTAQSLTLLDTDDPQEISFDFGLTSKVELQVTEIFEGDGFITPDISTDLALTEIAFVAVQAR